MKSPLPLLLILLAAAARQGLAQDSTTARPLNVRISSLQGHLSVGHLSAINDTAVVLTNHLSYGYHDMEHISFYRKGRVGRSTLIGLLIGAGTGLILGFASGDDDPNQWFAYTAGETAVGLGIFFGGVGTIAGLIAGLAKNKGFYIRGKKERYDRMHAKMAARLDIN